MESAIPRHLKAERKCPVNTPDQYAPPYPAWTARFTPLKAQIVMAYFGVQSPIEHDISVLAPITGRFSGMNAPEHWDIASCMDVYGYHNLIAIAYWPSVQAFEQWKTDSGFQEWWQAEQRESEAYGYFLEVVSPDASQFETLFSDKQSPEGVAHLSGGMSDEIVEHAYWGSARDRLPIAQTQSLDGTTEPQKMKQVGNRVWVQGKDNLCLIRSGQDWSATQDTEREKYLKEIEPVFHDGMNFLRDEGDSVGCFSCRYMRVRDQSTGERIEKTFGLAHFNSMGELEAWARNHPTHVAIFGGFMRYVQELNFQIALRLYHEISVIPASAQYFEYVNCHKKSGLLGQFTMDGQSK